MADRRPGRGKKPRAKFSPEPLKQARAADVVNYNNELLKWSFSVVDLHGPFGWSNINLGVLRSKLLDKVHHFERMKWHEIEGSKHHQIGKDSLSPDAVKRLNAVGQGDVDALFSIRLEGKERLIGIRDRDYFKILWRDPDHQVCPSSKKNT